MFLPKIKIHTIRCDTLILFFLIFIYREKKESEIETTRHVTL